VNRFVVGDTPLQGLKTVERQILGDSRGSLARLFCGDELRDAGWPGPVAQINHTVTRARGTVRGLHFQHPPHAECKLVSCLRGEVWDVAVDLRRGSPTFLRWQARTLSAENGLALLIPQGFAHGFQALTDNVELLYVHSVPHAPQAEGGLDALDPRLAIDWPLPVAERSPRDRQHAAIGAAFTGVEL
jgi:dTDP-4-dehydrorhamnose 3,5-epimerase